MMVLNNWSRFIGLKMDASIPGGRTVPFPPNPAIMTIGISASRRSVFMRLNTSTPFIPGIAWSRITSSK